MKIVIVNFSGRANGNCHAISDQIEALYPFDKVKRYDFHALSVSPCGNCDYECFIERNKCAYIKDDIYKIYENITNSDLVYFIVPNYCDYPNAHFFIFNERSQCYFQGQQLLLDKYLSVPKRFIVVSNTGKDNFIQAFGYHVSESDSLRTLILSPKRYGKISIAGDLMSSREAIDELKKFCSANDK